MSESSDPRPDAVAVAHDALAAIEPRAGAYERVLAGAESRLPVRSARSRRAAWVLVPAFVLAGGSALAWWAGARETAPPPVTPAGREAPPEPVRATPRIARAPAPVQVPEVSPPDSPVVAAPSEPAPPLDDDGDLAAVMIAFRQAQALRDVDDEAALARWRELRRRHPRSDLAPEIDFYLVDALVALGRLDEAREEARRFVRRHPASPHVERMRELAGPDPR
jgi:TolA-binding protein